MLSGEDDSGDDEGNPFAAFMNVRCSVFNMITQNMVQCVNQSHSKPMTAHK